MTTPTAAVRDFWPQRQAALGLVAFVAALGAGAIATTHYGVLAASALLGAAFFVGAAVIFFRDPVLALIGLWLFEVFNAPFSATFGYFSTTGKEIRQGDEILVLLFVVFTVVRTLRSTVRIPWRFVHVLVGVALFGFLSSIARGVPLKVAMVGGLLDLKLWIMVVITLLLPWRPRDLSRVYSTFVVVGVIVAVIGLLDYATHGAVSRALHTSNYNLREGSYRSESIHSIFPQPGEFSLFMSLLFALSFARFGLRFRRSDLLLALLFAGSVMLSLRLKGFLSLAVVIAVVGIVQGATSSRRAVAALLIGALVIGGAYDLEGSVISKQFSTYASSETSARARLYKTGEQIADEDFPLGVGFGRFASYPSTLYYSPVYYQYKLDRVYGLSVKFPFFIDDTSWPAVIGETGYGGLAAFVIGLVALIAIGIQRLRNTPTDLRWVPLAMLCVLGVILIDSLGEASLFSWLVTATFAMIVGPLMTAVPRRDEQRPALNTA
jgi:hypothetical protein